MMIILDAGHGMKTAGKETPAFPNGTKIKEAEQNYPIMFLVRDKLVKQGITVVTTNDDPNNDLSLNNRVLKANAVDAKLFVSFHKNATAEYAWNDVRGSETLVYKLGGEAEKAARIIQAEIVKGTGDKDRGVKAMGDKVYVLKYTKMPAVLVELGFMTNLEDANDMRNKQAQECYATAVTNGILKYLNITPLKVVETNVNEALYKNLAMEFKKLKSGLNDSLKQVEAIEALAAEMFGKL